MSDAQLSERDVRNAVYRLELKPNTKLCLLGVLHRVNWQSWTGSVSAKSISETMSLNERAVKRALRELTDLGLIERLPQSTPNGRNASAITAIKVSLIMGDIVTPSQCHNDTIHSDIVTLTYSDIETPLTTQPIIQPIEQPIEQPLSQPSEQEPELKPFDQSVWDLPGLPNSTPVTNRKDYR